jgi:hypothetical protein
VFSLNGSQATVSREIGRPDILLSGILEQLLGNLKLARS